VTNVTPGPPQPRAVTTPNPRSRQNQLIILAVFVVVLVLLVRACSGHENKYEQIAHDFTQAIQSNDYAAAVKLQNSESAAEMGHGRLGHAADVLAPLGKIVHIKENTPPNDGERVHEFDVAFQNGTVHEKIKFDPQDKIFRFDYHKIPK
jgi:hypothetical protein